MALFEGSPAFAYLQAFVFEIIANFLCWTARVSRPLARPLMGARLFLILATGNDHKAWLDLSL